MGILNKISNVIRKKQTVSRVELVSDMGNGYFYFDKKIYHSDIVRSCIRPDAKAAGKAVAKHIRRYNGELSINPDPYMRFLLEDPNPYMSGQQMQEKVSNIYQLNGNAYILILRDENGLPYEMYPIVSTTVKCFFDKNGMLFYEFYLKNGKKLECSSDDIIHLKNDYYDDDIFGESPIKTILPLMEVVQTTDQGIVKAVKNSAVIQWLFKFTRTLKPEDIKKNTKAIVDSYMNVDSETVGAMGVDNTVDEARQVESKDYVPNAALVDRTHDRIITFFNTNKKIISSSYTEDEWNAYYEAKTEPYLLQCKNEYTRKLFTRKERSFGNEIIFQTANLAYATLSTKLAFVALVDRGAMLPNEWRETLGLGPIEGGDKPIRRLDTGVVGDGNGKE
ncbi:MAG: phage portal protein [Candidatus Izemoplasmatales bacterium]|nr:phage portal protein [Candidatus Izemoplasmatales bacterium]